MFFFFSFVFLFCFVLFLCECHLSLLFFSFFFVTSDDFVFSPILSEHPKTQPPKSKSKKLLVVLQCKPTHECQEHGEEAPGEWVCQEGEA